MGRKSIATKTAGEISRRRHGKSSMSSIYRQKVISKYPECIGIMIDCPQLIENPKAPPEKCGRCPNFMESHFYRKPSTEEKVQELRALFEEFRKK